MNIKLTPFYKQQLGWDKLLDKKTEFIIYGGAAGGGKSWLGCEWLLTNCLQYPNTRWFIGRKELTRLMESTYLTWEKVCSFHKIPRNYWKLNGQYHYIQFNIPYKDKDGKSQVNKSRIDLKDLAFKPSDPMYEGLGSTEYTGGWLEEASQIDFLAFDTLKSRVGRQMNKEYDLFPAKIFLTCNPAKNWIYQNIYKPWKKGELPENYCFLPALYKDNPHIKDEYGKKLAQIKDKVLRQRLMQGIWEYSDDDAQLIDYDAITDLFTNTVDESKNKFLVCDVARFGQDKTVIMLWEGFKVYKTETWKKQGLDVTAKRIKELARKKKIPYSNILVDEDGVGGGVVDMLKGIKGFTNNASAIVPKKQEAKENYKNLKTQCAYILSQKINGHEIAIETEDMKLREHIIEELEQIRRKDPDKEGKLMITSKDEVKATLGRSPDYSDCLLMRMFFTIKVEEKRGMKTYYPGQNKELNAVTNNNPIKHTFRIFGKGFDIKNKI